MNKTPPRIHVIVEDPCVLQGRAALAKHFCEAFRSGEAISHLHDSLRLLSRSFFEGLKDSKSQLTGISVFPLSLIIDPPFWTLDFRIQIT